MGLAPGDRGPDAKEQSLAKEKHDAILLFGMPGAGKGTQGKALGALPGLLHLSMGDVFRGLDRNSPMGKVFVEFSSRGELVPDDVTINIWREHMAALAQKGHYKPGVDIALLDGIPRNLAQADLLKGDLNVLLALHLTTGDDERMVARLRARALKEGRADDAREEVIRRRLQIYRAETEPLLRVYPTDRVKPVEAIGAPAEVLRRILDHLAPLQAVRFAAG